jgi:Mn2+/Fe2+ NRAMP family transporter
MPAIVISILGSIVSGMVLFFLQRYLKKSEHREEERNKARSKENVLILKSIDAIGKLTYADAIAIRDGKTNGEMKAAIEEYNEVKEDMYNYLLEQNSKRDY